MKFALILTAVFFSLSSFAQIDAAQICDQNLKADRPLFQTALNNLKSFSYVRKALNAAAKDLEPAQICVSMIALANNAYRYYQYSIQIEVKSSNQEPGYRFHFIFQDASVQAFHNVGHQPWVAVDPASAQKAADRMVQQAQWSSFDHGNEPINWRSLARRSKTFQAQMATLDAETLSVIPLSTSQLDSKVFLVTWMSLASASNVFSSPMTTHGVLFRLNPDQTVEIAENATPVSDWLFPLQEESHRWNQKISANQDEWSQKLLEISKLPK